MWSFEAILRIMKRKGLCAQRVKRWREDGRAGTGEDGWEEEGQGQAMETIVLRAPARVLPPEMSSLSSVFGSGDLVPSSASRRPLGVRAGVGVVRRGWLAGQRGARRCGTNALRRPRARIRTSLALRRPRCATLANSTCLHPFHPPPAAFTIKPDGNTKYSPLWIAMSAIRLEHESRATGFNYL